jgi:hypothetical protein
MSLKAAQGDTISLGIRSCRQEFRKVQIIRDAILWLAMLFGIAATGLFGTPALFRKMFVNSNVRLF